MLSLSSKKEGFSEISSILILPVLHALVALDLDLKREVLKKTVSDENTVVVDLIATGTAKDGTKMKLPMQTIFTFQNGKIIKDFSTHNK